MKLVLQIACGVVLGGLVVLGLILLFMAAIAKSVNEQSQATLQRMQQQQAAIQIEQRQRSAAADTERQRQIALARQQDREAAARQAAARQQAARKEQAWNRYYQPLEKCRHLTTQQIVVECGNDNIRQRRTFEQLWQQGHFGIFPP